eukprot:12881862-Prorocentrum_lima.AAC.1
MEWPSSKTSATTINTTMATACTNQPSEPTTIIAMEPRNKVQGGPTSPTGYEGAGRPRSTTQAWKQYTGWQDYN